MTYKHNNKDPNLNNLHHAMEYSPDGLPHVRVTLGSDNITINGDVTIPTPLPVTQDPTSTPWQISKNTTANTQGNPIYVNVTNGISTVSLSQGTLDALETINVNLNAGTNVIGKVDQNGIWTVGLSQTTLDALETVTVNQGTGGTSAWKITGNVTVDSIPEVEIKNDTGNPIPVTWVYGNSADAVPWELQVSRGKIAGVTNLNISGYNNNVGTTFVPIWHNTINYVYPATASTMRVWSDSASDTNISVLVTGLDSNYNIITETIVLTNGITGVITTNQFFRINNLAVTRTPMNVGVIFCGNSAKTEYYNTIEIGAGRSQQTVYTIPAGYTFYLTQSNFYTNNTGNNVGLYRSWTQTATGVVNIILTSPFPVNYSSRKVAPRAYPEKTDIQWQVASKSGSAEIGGQIEGYLIANSVA